MSYKKIQFVFFGTPDLAVFVLEELERGDLIPSLIVTSPDKPAGRGMKLTSPPVKVWAGERNIPVLQPKKLKAELLPELQKENYEVGVVTAYGKIVPQEMLDAFPHGILNVHPSLLPKHRGATPIPSSILAGDEETGVTIMQMDAGMDTGPILERRTLSVESRNAQELGEELVRLGGRMLVDIIPKWAAGEMKALPQDDDKATYTQKITKADGEIDPAGDPEENWRKFRAYYRWPGIYFFTKGGTPPHLSSQSASRRCHGQNWSERCGGSRVKITDAEFKDGEFVIKKIIPEGKKEVDYEVFKKSN